MLIPLLAHGKETATSEHEYLEVKFSVGNSFDCGFSQQGKEQKPFLTIGSGYSRAFHSNKMSDLETLKTNVASEIAKLKELGAK